MTAGKDTSAFGLVSKNAGVDARLSSNFRLFRDLCGWAGFRFMRGRHHMLWYRVSPPYSSNSFREGCVRQKAL